MKQIILTKALATMSIDQIVANTNYIEKLRELGNYYVCNEDDLSGTSDLILGKTFLELHSITKSSKEQLSLFNDLSIEQLSCLEMYLTDGGTLDQVVSINTEHIKDIVNLTPGNFKLILKG